MGTNIRPSGQGRRPGASQTRQSILSAATIRFADRGYAATSLRTVAGDAGVDVALIGHYFGSKAGLFAASVQWPLDPAEAIRHVIDGDRTHIASRLSETFVAHWSATGWRSPMIALVSAAATDEAVAEILRDFLTKQLLVPMMIELGIDNAELRAGLMSSCLVGLGLGRYTLGLIGPDRIDDIDLIRALTPVLNSLMASELAVGRA